MSGFKSSSLAVVAVPDNDSNDLLAEIDNISPHAFGDFTGALSWTVPWTTAQQSSAYNAASSYLQTLDSYGKPGLGVLDHLNGGQPLSSEVLADPASAVEVLVRGPQGQALGLAVQTKMNSVSSDVSIDEHALAAIQLLLGRLSIGVADRNIVADFDLADTRNWGQTAATIVRNFRDFLELSSKSSAAMSGLTAHVALTGYASVYLIKEIPDSVRYGSAAWVNLAVAAAVIEARTPGKVANMTFAQVMICAESAELDDPEIARLAQTSALIDWGFIHGLIEEKADDRVTDAELNVIAQEYNRQLNERLEASKWLSSEIPSRKVIALNKLKEKFPGNVPFETPVFYDTRSGVDVGVDEVFSATWGLHSLLDIAMMGGPPYYTWGTEYVHFSYLVPAINSNLELGIEKEFKHKFDKTIVALKRGAMATVRYLISQLPLQDREKLEYGQIDFFQSKIYRLRSNFWGRDLTHTAAELTMRVELNGEVTLYYINLKKGVIGRHKKHPGKETEVPQPSNPSLIHATELFKAERPLNATSRFAPYATPRSYSSERTTEIAFAFAQHLDLDNNKVLQEARGQTTRDIQAARLNAAVDFVLDLIPFKSAISNFIKGNYADGTMDLFMDVLGFVTAGAGIVSKLAKVATQSVSALTKALRAARIIGTFVIGELNPLSALPALVGGTVSLVGRGLRFVGVRPLRHLDWLRNAPDGYKLLHAVGKEHGVTVLGTFKMGDGSVAGVGVLKNGEWYPYNAQTNRLYGSPGAFTPKAPSANRLHGPNTNDPGYFVGYHSNLLNARAPNNLPAYNKGFDSGELERIPGYNPTMELEDLYTLASRSDWSPEQIGALTKEIKNRLLDDAAYFSSLLLQDCQGAGVKVTSLSQSYYSAYVDLTTKGECAGLSNAMAVAIHYGKEQIFLQNFYKVSNKSDNPPSQKFIRDLRNFQDKVADFEKFHPNGNPDVMSADNIIADLLSSPDSKSLRISTRDHAMVAGVRVIDGKPAWYFYDPNAGLAKFESIQSMKEGLYKVLESGALASTHNTFRNTKGGHVYQVSEFRLDDIDPDYIDRVEDLSHVELPDLSDELFSIQVVR
jgi:hypothetical protein